MRRAERELNVDCGVLYEQVQREFARVVDALDTQQLAVRVPATPDWAVRDVLAHVVGLAAALNALDLPAADDEGGTAWAARQVATRRERPIGELLAEWAVEAPVFAEGLRLFGYEFGCHFVADLLVHLHDVQAAVALRPYTDATALAVALDHYCDHLSGLLSAAEWGVMVVGNADGERRTLGTGAERAQVVADPYDLLRTFAARRSEAQVRSLSWSGDVQAVVAFLRHSWSGGYTLPIADQP